MDALEAIAAEVRLRPYRTLAAEHGIPLETLLRNVEQAQAKRERLRADGLTDEQIDARTAADIGITVDELQRRVDELVARFG